MNAFKQGKRQGELCARDGWHAFRKSTNVEDIALTDEVRDVILESSERPLRPFLKDKEWDAFRKGFHKGHVAKTKSLVRSIMPSKVVKSAPQISAIIQAIQTAADIDSRTVEGSVKRLRETFRVTMAGTLSASSNPGKLGRQAGAEAAAFDWQAFETTSEAQALVLTRYDLTEKAFTAALQYLGNDVHAQAHMDFAGAYESIYSAKINEKIDRLVPKEVKPWSNHLLALIRALGLDQQPTIAPEPMPSF